MLYVKYYYSFNSSLLTPHSSLNYYFLAFLKLLSYTLYKIKIRLKTLKPLSTFRAECPPFTVQTLSFHTG